MPGLFNRLKNFIPLTVIKSADVNGELNNIIANMIPKKIDNYSTNVAQMQIQTDPGGLGTESLAPELSGELERLRFVIARGFGTAYWYISPSITLSQVTTLLKLGIGIPDNRVVSGLTRPSAAQAAYLVPAGTSNSVTLKAGGSNPNFVVFIKGSQYTITSDISFMGLSPAPSTNNTATINDVLLSGDYPSSFAGERDAPIQQITISGAGSEIIARVGTYAAFSVTNGGGTEYFIGHVDSPTQISGCFRGYFFDSTSLPVDRIPINDGDTLELLRLTWIFIQTNGTMMDVAYNQPKWQYSAPSSPSVGDYWFDLSTNIWKRFNSSAWVDANATLIGVTIQDTTNTVGARSLDFFAVYNALNTLLPETITTVEAQAKQKNGEVSVYGQTFAYGDSYLTWDTGTDRDTGVSLSPNTEYYLYVKETGKQVISDVRPYDREADLLGYYHPHQYWRSVGTVSTDGASLLLPVDVKAQVTGRSIEDLSISDRKIITGGVIQRNIALESVDITRQTTRVYVTTVGTSSQIIFSDVPDGVQAGLTQVASLSLFRTGKPYRLFVQTRYSYPLAGTVTMGAALAKMAVGNPSGVTNTIAMNGAPGDQFGASFDFGIFGDVTFGNVLYTLHIENLTYAGLRFVGYEL